MPSDAGLLPLRAFDQRYGLTRGLAEHLCDPREEECVRHSVLSLFRQRPYQIIAGHEDADDADRLRYDPAFQIHADQPLVNLSDHNQLSVAGRTRPRLATSSSCRMLYSIGS